MSDLDLCSFWIVDTQTVNTICPYLPPPPIGEGEEGRRGEERGGEGRGGELI